MKQILKNLFPSGKKMKNIIIGLIFGLIIAMWAFYFFSKKTTLITDNIPTKTIDSDETLIKKALAKKYQKDLSEVDFSLSKNEGTHASGGVKFAGEIAGAWVLAAKKDNQWIIVQDGNGTISCELVSPYNFPPSIVSECVDKDGKLNKF